MAEERKRATSPLKNGEPHGQSGKKARAQGMTANVVVKAETEEDQGEGEVHQGSSSDGGMGATEAMEEPPQISFRFERALFHCRACRGPLKPPTFKCQFGHLVCFGCRNSHSQVCGGGGVYVACVEVDAFLRDAKQPCAFEEFGCQSAVVYHEAAEHRAACQWAPCSCPFPGCGVFTSPTRLVDHFAAAHAWPVTEVSYGKPRVIPVPPLHGYHALVGRDDRCVFIVSTSEFGMADAVSLVCLRANDDAAAGVPQYRCKLWAEVKSNGVNMTMMMSMVESSSMSGGFPAADLGMFLAVPLNIQHDVSGDAANLMVRIDRIGGAGVTSTTPPPSSSSRRPQ